MTATELTDERLTELRELAAVATLGLEAREWEKFWSHVDQTGGCWIWRGTLNMYGYAYFNYRSTRRLGHRVAYMWLVGPIPKSLVLDHLCRVRNCVNPAHLEPVTQRENVLRGEGVSAKLARQTHCKRGHEFTPENTIARSNGSRVCKVCNRNRQKKYYGLRATCPVCGEERSQYWIPRHIKAMHS